MEGSSKEGRAVSDFRGATSGAIFVSGRCAGIAADGISYRDLEQMAERGVSVDHSTIYRWVQK